MVNAFSTPRTTVILASGHVILYSRERQRVVRQEGSWSMYGKVAKQILPHLSTVSAGTGRGGRGGPPAQSASALTTSSTGERRCHQGPAGLENFLTQAGGHAPGVSGMEGRGRKRRQEKSDWMFTKGMEG